ncbi:Spc98 family-domain-containing protein [Trametes polyzona]|nr:Spc98 family-domain-containing protein [Trametes polyzona]
MVVTHPAFCPWVSATSSLKATERDRTLCPGLQLTLVSSVKGRSAYSSDCIHTYILNPRDTVGLPQIPKESYTRIMNPSSSKPKPVRPTIRPPSSIGLRRDEDGWYSAASPQLSASSARPPSAASGLRPSSSAPMRPPSSASTRPPSSAGIRSSQSAPLRPGSSAATRPPSSASVRPGSSVSVRPPSSASGRRPISRFSHRAPTRQSSRLLPLCESLVTQLTSLTPAADAEDFQAAVDYVAKNLDSTVRPSGSTDFATIDKVIRGHARKARINSHDILGDALDKAYNKLKTHAKANDDLDSSIQLSRLPDHLKFLTLLSNPPDPTTLANAEAIIHKMENPERSKPALTWKDILAEEPFEGQHWEGVYGLPPGSTVEGWETRSDGSTPSLSPWDSDSDLDESQSSSDLSAIPETPPPAPPAPRSATEPGRETVIDPLNAYRHRQDVEELQARQYWRPEWQEDANLEKTFDIGDASSLAPSFHRALGSRAALSIDGPSKESYRHEEDIVREVLTGLQGRRNMMFTWTHSGAHAFSFVLSPTAPRLLHLTAGAQASIIASFASLATTLVHLRKFTSAIFAKASISNVHPDPSQPAHLTRTHRRSTQTLEAFADALDTELRAFDSWCASREESICRARGGVLSGPPLVVSLLSLEKSVRDAFGDTFSVLLSLVRSVVQQAQRSKEPIIEVWTLPDLPPRSAPSAVTALLLNGLLDAVQERASMGDTVTAHALARVFGASAEPLWEMMHRWMRDGMPVRDTPALSSSAVGAGMGAVADEFFVEDNEVVMLDPDFWADGFTLRDGRTVEGEEGVPTGVPVFLVHVAELVLATGKVTGLLRALGVSSLFDGDGDGFSVVKPWMSSWRSFTALLEQPVNVGSDEGEVCIDTLSPESVIASSESLSRAVYDELLPYSEQAHEALTRVLVEDCDLWGHLNAIEDLFLMRRGDAMSHFVDILFTRMDARQPWNDFHFMNSAFRDVVARDTAPRRVSRWIDPSLVRFSYRAPAPAQERNAAQSVRALDGLLVEYAVPFPLTYIFGPRTMRVLSAVFTLVLQVRRAKSVLERILVRGGVVAGGRGMDAEMKVFYAVRGRLSWFVNTLLNFITTNVIHTQILRFHETFRKAKSLDEMIQLQNEHLDKLEGRCLLQRNTAALHRAILSILDMSLAYTECFVAVAGDTTHDISRTSLRLRRARHRSRRVRAQRRDVIGFADASAALDPDFSSSSSEDEDEDNYDLGGGGHGARAEPSFSLGSVTASSFAEDEGGPGARLEKMAAELDALVRFVRRGVESLAAGTGEAAPAFGMFAFALEDWDR